MISKGEFADMIKRLRYICRTGRRLVRLSKGREKVSEEELADVEYVNECLWIELCRLGLRGKGFIWSKKGKSNKVEVYRRCLKEATWQAGRLLRELQLERNREMVTHNTWCNVESAETLMQRIDSCYKNS